MGATGFECTPRHTQGLIPQHPHPRPPHLPTGHPRPTLAPRQLPVHQADPSGTGVRVYCHGRWPHVTVGPGRVVTDDCVSHGWLTIPVLVTVTVQARCPGHGQARGAVASADAP